MAQSGARSWTALLCLLLAVSSAFAFDNECSQHGTLEDDGTCHCVFPYTRSDCSLRNASMPVDMAFVGYADAGKFNYFFFDVPAEPTFNLVKVTMNQIGASGDPDLYGRIGAMPTTTIWDKADMSASESHYITFSGKDFQKNARYYFGVFGYEAASFNLTLHTEMVCPGAGDCSGHGDCRQGICRCWYGYQGDDCSTMTALAENTWRYGSVLANNWVSVAVDVDLTLSTRMRVELEDRTTSDAGDARLYVRFGAMPTTWQYDYTNRTQTQPGYACAIDVSPAALREGKYYLAVYGGKDSSFRIRYSTTPVHGEVAYHRMMVYTYSLDLYSRNGLNLKLTWTNPDQKGQPELYLRYGAYPTRYQYDWRNDSDITSLELDLHTPDLNKTGAYYIGVYGSENVPGTAQFDLVATASLSCLNNCNAPHGTCDGATGKCTCRDGYLGEGCQIAVVASLKDGAQINVDSLAHHEWACYYTWVDNFVMDLEATLTQVGPASRDVDLYLRADTYPTDRTYDARDIATRAVSRVELHSPKLHEGIYYTCAYAYQGPVGFNLTMSLSRSLCEANCSGHGVCGADAQCVCEPGWAGPACAAPEVELPTDGTSLAGTVEVGKWRYYHFDVTPSAAINDLIISLNATSGDPDLFVRVGGYPSWSVYNWSDVSESQSAIRVHVPALVGGRYWVGIYGFKAAQGAATVQYALSAHLGNRCPNDCNGHGPCVDGRCQCSDEWVLDDCSAPFGVLPNQVTVKDVDVASKTWHFWYVDVPEGANDLVINVKYRGMGEPFLFVRARALPTQEQFDQSDHHRWDQFRSHPRSSTRHHTSRAPSSRAPSRAPSRTATLESPAMHAVRVALTAPS
ncbi:hypothetical protein PAPYR_5068 [Paratrimastix pyriformis]|uniref:EGF-like domain-containing protein n=1 Tax=Paratrimastix pyriformis TaxID=342808 RepID=A0ABQ8UMT4_9EUKA|nr:hypothetical protein PAPYR_5068 [Paratrimastix pyriformis]